MVGTITRVGTCVRRLAQVGIKSAGVTLSWSTSLAPIAQGLERTNFHGRTEGGDIPLLVQPTEARQLISDFLHEQELSLAGNENQLVFCPADIAIHCRIIGEKVQINNSVPTEIQPVALFYTVAIQVARPSGS